GVYSKWGEEAERSYASAYFVRFGMLEGCVHAQHFENRLKLDPGCRVSRGAGGRAVQEWRSSDGTKFADAEPPWGDNAENWANGHHDCLPRAVGGRTRDLGKDGSVRQGVAGWRKRKHDDYVSG